MSDPRPHPMPTLGALVTLVLLWPGVCPAISSRISLTVSGGDGDQAGKSVASAGDVNGDGFDDIIVGIPYAGAGTEGAAWILFGGPDEDGVADVVLQGEASSDQFGWSVAGAGDLNGDGFDDAVVGAPQWGSSAGRVYVYLGGPSMDSVADLTLAGVTDQRLGFSVGSAGDMNGDGFEDLVVGAPSTPLTPGHAYVYFGAAIVDGIPDLTFPGSQTGDELGFSVGSAGDVNGDGFDDVVVGRIPGTFPVPFLGSARIYLGGLSPNSTFDASYLGLSTSDGFGKAVSAAGDLNGDGFDDVIVGAPDDDSDGSNAGRAYVYFGSVNVDETEDLVLSAEAAGDRFGQSVASAGDTNGDGFADLIVGAPSADPSNGADAGRAYVFFGGSSLNNTADFTFSGEELVNVFGSSVASVGDFDGNGLDDLLVGAPFHGAENSGRVYLLSTFHYRILAPTENDQWTGGEVGTVRWEGRDVADIMLSSNGGLNWTVMARGVGGSRYNEHEIPAPLVNSDHAYVRLRYQGETVSAANSATSGRFRIVLPVEPSSASHLLTLASDGQSPGDHYGRSVSSAGDFNGDGFDDVIVGAEFGGAGAGSAYVIYRGPGQDDIADLILTGEAVGDSFGADARAAGDFNADGWDDVIVGAGGNDALALDGGSAYIYLGGPGADNAPDFVMSGPIASARNGASVASAGDVNGDGYDDVIVGGPQQDGSSPGAALIYFGGPSADTVLDLILFGEIDDDRFGFSVDGAGDVNGDGFDDFVVGARQNDATGPNAGRAYLYFGGPALDNTADLILSAEAGGDRFGHAVRGVGDVDGDGFADLLVSAFLNDAVGGAAGRAYLFRGGSIPDATADLVLDGEAAGDHFGVSIGAAGDVNQDGFDDLLVGANLNDAGGDDAGRAYVYFGGPGADTFADIVLTGEVAGDAFGRSVGSAGDGDGDGFPDIIIGANNHDAGGLDAGRAYLYDLQRYHVLSPTAGALWNVGATETVSWLGSEPTDLWLSVNGGASYELLRASVGGHESNAVSLLVPHVPTRFARLKLTPTEFGLSGSSELDSLFTVEASIAVLAFGAQPQGSGTLVSWQTDPGPDELSGYRLERAFGSGWNTIVPHTRETSYEDPDGSAGSRYRLTGINGLGDEYVIGETTIGTVAALAAGPLPYRGGDLRISFGTLGGLAGARGAAELSLYDVNGRRVRTISRGDFPAGTQSAVWDGRDQTGRFVSAGIYFLRVETPGNSRTLKLAVIR